MRVRAPYRWLFVLALGGCGHRAARAQPSVVVAGSVGDARPTSARGSDEPRATKDASTPVRLTHAQAVRDARRLFELLESSHPDPYSRLGGKIGFKRRAQALVDELPAGGIDTDELGDRLATFLGALRDGHTFIATKNSRWEDRGSWLPIGFAVASDGLYIAGHDLAALRGKRGHRVAAIAGQDVDGLADRLSELLAIENRIGAYAKLGVVLRSKKMLANLLGGGELSSVVVRLVSPRGKALDVELDYAQASDAPPARWAEPEPQGAQYAPGPEPFEARFFGDVAHLRVREMMGREGFESMLRFGWGDARSALARWHEQRHKPMPEDVEEALANVPSFIEVASRLLDEMKAKKTKTLVVDLRGNSGGVTTTFMVFAQMLYGEAVYGVPFAERFVQVPSELMLAKYKTTLADYAKREGQPNLRPGEYLFPAKVAAATARAAAVADWKKAGMSYAARMEALGPAPVYTPPRVVALCDVDTFSAGFHALYLLDGLGAITIGVPARQSPNAFMEVTDFELPESKLRGSISNAAQLLLPDDPGATVYPLDHAVDGKIFARYRFDRETILRFALDLLRRE